MCSATTSKSLNLSPVERNVILGLIQRVEADLSFMFDLCQDEYGISLFLPGYNSSRYNESFLLRIYDYLSCVGFTTSQISLISLQYRFQYRGYK